MSTPVRLSATAPLLVALAGSVMLAAIAYATWHGDFAAEGKALLSMPWGVVSLIDIYVGIALFGGWVAWRERSVLRTGLVMGCVVLLGNLASCAYVLLALTRARGDANAFWHGARAPQPLVTADA